MKLSQIQVQSYQKKLQADFGEKDHARMVAIIAALDPQAQQVSVTAAMQAAFSEDGRSTESQEKLLGQLRERFNSLAEEAGYQVRCVVAPSRAAGADKQFLYFEGEALFEVAHTTDELRRATANLILDPQGLPLRTEPRISLLTLHPQSGKPLVRWFASYAHHDKKATEFIGSLRIRLGNHRHYHFEAWDDRQILVGEQWHEQIQQALQQCHLGVLLLSHAFLASPYIGKHELPTFLAGQDSGAPGKRAIPVALQAINFANTDLKGLAEHQIYRDAEQRAYVQRSGSKRDEWLDGLVEQMTKVLDRHADKPSTEVSALVTPRVSAAKPKAVRWVRARDMLSPDIEGLPHLMTEVFAKPTVLEARLLVKEASGKSEERGVNVLDHLLDWAEDVSAPPLFAVLGEYGMGKTINCQRLVREIEVRREAAHAAGSHSALPQALYFDLRKLTQLRGGTVPNLPEVIDECVQRGWALGCEKPSAAELIERGQHHALLWVFDGLDEALVHLTERQGQQFTQELLRLQPMAGHGAHPLTRVLISCRTHFFRTLRDQNSHFTGQERVDHAGADYRALMMLPLGEGQILSYLQNALPGLDPQATLDLVKSVHNLSELAERPFTLRLVSEFIPQIEHWRALGKPVYGVTLYQEMVNRWIARDNGKHHLRAEHKQQLMAELAAWLWREGQRLMPAARLETWFHAWLADDVELRLLYSEVGFDKLDEDLRTATFLVREDGAKDGAVGNAAEVGGFRFAHSSMLEFFLARYLFNALQENRREAWSLPLVSRETRQFLADFLLASGSPGLLGTLSSWCAAPYLSMASEQCLRYAIDAQSQKWPLPVLTGLDMRGADLQGWQFIGHSEQEPLNLNGSCFADCELRETEWCDVQLNGADFTAAQLGRCEWWRVWAPGLIANAVQIDGANFRHVQWPASRWQGATGQSPWFMHTEAPPPWRAEQLVHAEVLSPGCQPVGVLPRWQNSRPSSESNACCIAPDGMHALSAGSGGTLQLWRLATGRCVAEWVGHQRRVKGCCFSPDGRHVLSASADWTLKLWQVATGLCVATWAGHED